MIKVSSAEIEKMKWAFTTRRVERSDVVAVSSDLSDLAPGDLICAEVDRIGQHSGLQLSNGRRSVLYAGDIVVVCAGARYAPDQFECEARIAPPFCSLVAAGGVAGTVTRKHAKMSAPTRLRVVGRLVGAGGKPLNIGAYAMEPAALAGRPMTFGVLGTSMNAGKTTTAASLIKGLSEAGFVVGACKATGTGAFCDFNAMLDAGAEAVLDFTDLGYATTFGVDTPALERVLTSLIAALCAKGANAIVVEVADGLLQQETAALIATPAFRAAVDGVLFAAADAMSAIAGVKTLEAQGLPVLGVSGIVSASPLASSEVACAVTTPVLTRETLCNGVQVLKLIRDATILRPNAVWRPTGSECAAA